MRLRWVQEHTKLVKFMGAVNHPDGSIHVYETTEYPDKSRTQREVFPDDVVGIMIPVGTVLLLNKKGYMDDKSCIDTVTNLIASHDFRAMMQEQGWTDVTIGPWTKRLIKPLDN